MLRQFGDVFYPILSIDNFLTQYFTMYVGVARKREHETCFYHVFIFKHGSNWPVFNYKRIPHHVVKCLLTNKRQSFGSDVNLCFEHIFSCQSLACLPRQFNTVTLWVNWQRIHLMKCIKNCFRRHRDRGIILRESINVNAADTFDVCLCMYSLIYLSLYTYFAPCFWLGYLYLYITRLCIMILISLI